MYATLFAVIAPILIISGLGALWARLKMPYDANFVSQLTLNIGAPCLIIAKLGSVQLPQGDIGLMAFVTLIGMVAVTLVSVLVIRLLGLSLRVYLPSLIFPNTGNMGLPLCLFAFGEAGMAVALILFIVTSLLHFSLGVALVSGENVWQRTLRSPVVYSAILATVLIVTQWRLPQWLGNTVGLLGEMSIPLMLLSLGVSLATLQIQSLWRSLGLGALRLVIGFGVGFTLCEVFALEGVMRGVVLIEFSMPAAVFNYLLASRYARCPEEVASLVVSSTLMSFILLPALLWFAMAT